MSNNVILKVVILSLVLMVSVVFLTQPASADHPEEEVLPEAGLTSASPFHVFERFGDWARLNVLTFGAARKAEVKVHIAEKRLSELRAVIESGADASTVESAESFTNSSAASLQNDAEILDARGQDASALIEKLNGLSLKQQAVLERVLEKAPEQAKKAITRAIENSRKGLEKAEEVLQKQVERKLIATEKAKEILEKSVGRLQEQVEQRSERLKEIVAESGEVPPELQAAFEEKLKLLEDRLINVESKEEFKEVRKDIRENLKDAASKVLEIRKEHQLRDDVSEGFLKDVEMERVDVAQKAKEAIVSAERATAEVLMKIKRAEETQKTIPENVKELLRNAEEHLKKAKESYDAKNFGEAFGQATASFRNASSANKFLENMIRRVEAAGSPAKVEIKKRVETKIEANTETNLKRPLPTEVKPETAVKPEETANVSAKTEDVKLDAEQSNTTAVPVPERVSSVVVKFTKNGYEPREIKVQKGGSVTWVNESGGVMWPASAVHPTHDVYPQKGGCLGSTFDACKRVENGEKYEFRFDHLGTWRYHDHVNPSLTGSVTVAE